VKDNIGKSISKINTEWEEHFRKMNEEMFGKHNQALVDKFTSLEERIKENNLVSLKNGKIRITTVQDAVGHIHDELYCVSQTINKIEKIIEPLSDFQRLHYLMKKYRLYRLLGILFSIAIIKEIIFVALGK